MDLRELDAYLVPLLEQPAGYRPFALPIHGSYDYYGGLDTDPDELVTLLDQFVARCLRSGRLVVDERRVQPAGTLMELAMANHVVLEITGRHACHLDSHGLAYALISEAAWNACVEQGRTVPDSGAPIASPYLEEIYGDRLTDWAEPLQALTAVNAALALLDLAWRRPEFL
ncbi:hypothetical protein [Kribbella flavida]|uniref:hypothetical protein n=1 Tax=Kribbella flavida TaxID=182640 RepID=UPI0011D29904|nr:hypothetical protein [Kribbella flavida]